MMPRLTWDFILARISVNRVISKIIQEQDDSGDALRLVYNELIKVVTFSFEDFDLHLKQDSILYIAGTIFKSMSINGNLIADIIFLHEIEPSSLSKEDIDSILSTSPPETIKHQLNSAVLSAHA